MDAMVYEMYIIMQYSVHAQAFILGVFVKRQNEIWDYLKDATVEIANVSINCIASPINKMDMIGKYIPQ